VERVGDKDIGRWTSSSFSQVCSFEISCHYPPPAPASSNSTTSFQPDSCFPSVATRIGIPPRFPLLPRFAPLQNRRLECRPLLPFLWFAEVSCCLAVASSWGTKFHSRSCPPFNYTHQFPRLLIFCSLLLFVSESPSLSSWLRGGRGDSEPCRHSMDTEWPRATELEEFTSRHHLVCNLPPQGFHLLFSRGEA